VYTANDQRVRQGGQPIVVQEPQMVAGQVRQSLVSKFLMAQAPDSSRLVAGVAIDITEREQSEAKFRNLLEGAPDALIIVDEMGRIRLVNQKAESLFGYTRNELIDSMVEMLIPLRLRDRHVGHRARYAQAPKARPMGAGTDLLARRKDGQEFPVEISLSPLETQEGLLVTAAVRDITVRKQAEQELEASRRQLAMTEKLSALGTLVSGVGHEIRTPLTYISANVALVDAHMAACGRFGPEVEAIGKDVSQRTAKIQEGVARIERIVRQLRQFGLPQLKRTPVGLDQVVLQAVELFRAAHRGEVNISTDLSPTPAFDMDEGQIQQVVINLLNNGLESMGRNGRLEVRTREVDGEAVIEVHDHGPGIPDAVQKRLFDPFFTTKSQGTGLGLSISRRIVEAHRGRMTYTTSPEHGTTFVVRLPVGQEAAA
jgi:PAS domain S-box-containing protein